VAFYASLGLVRQDGSRLVVSDEGMPLLDALLGELVPGALVAA
jgi:oxygen-independent coproporphyrinogen-3 oxidase